MNLCLSTIYLEDCLWTNNETRYNEFNEDFTRAVFNEFNKGLTRTRYNEVLTRGL